ncbi:MAG TPA: hypothetical protein VF756_16570 [Thermoanaerobaculia bacterium]
MGLSRIVVVAVVLVLAGSLLPLSAEPEATVVPAVSLPNMTSMVAPSPEIQLAGGCVLYHCPWYIDSGCSCELVWCGSGYACGVPWDGASSGAAFASCGVSTDSSAVQR